MDSLAHYTASQLEKYHLQASDGDVDAFLRKVSSLHQPR